MCNQGVLRHFRSSADRVIHVKWVPRLAEIGVAPPVLHVDETGMCLARCDRFDIWWPTASADVLAETGRQVASAIRRMHALGICHRDMHHHNVMLHEGNPVFIDFEHAIEVAPTLRCYDLYGPGEVSLLPDHVRWGGVLGTHGIWWGAPLEPRFDAQYVPMGKIFGPLELYLADH